uniref:MHC class I-like antigen recognition-like domain-containing protein n=1 Tax=Astyanax mexicanus TaxID=7994 RepID=A0A8B9H545_ASTMX
MCQSWVAALSSECADFTSEEKCASLWGITTDRGSLSVCVEIYIYSVKYTAAVGISGLPEFTATSFLHGKQIDYYDSKDHILLPRKDWAKKILGVPYWEKTTRLRFSDYKECFSLIYPNYYIITCLYPSGMHTFQRMYGCLWDGKTGESDGFDVYGYDGENFLSLDVNSRKFTALTPQAKSIVQEWNRNTTRLEVLQLYYKLECVAWLKTFFPENYNQNEPWIRMSWQRNEKDFNDGFVVIGDTLPSGDGTFQKTIYLYVGVEDLMRNQYKCVLEFVSLAGKSILQMSQDTKLQFSYGTESVEFNVFIWLARIYSFCKRVTVIFSYLFLGQMWKDVLYACAQVHLSLFFN